MSRRAGLAGIAATGLAYCALVWSGCGGGDRDQASTDQGPDPLSARIVNTGGVIPRVRPRDLKKPMAEYLDHVDGELATMQGDVSRLASAASSGDVDGAKQAWLDADARYETIGAAYGAFGDLDAAINGRPGGLEGGIHSEDFTGLHRIELALWGHGSAEEAAPYAEDLAEDVGKLRAKLPHAEIDPLDYVLRSHEVLEDTLHLQLSGVASPWASAALTALRANIDGTEFLLGTIRPLIERRNPQRLAAIARSLADLKAAMKEVTGPDGSLPRWDALPLRRRELINARVAAAAEQLAYVPGIANPLPPRPLQDSFGQGEGDDAQ